MASIAVEQAVVYEPFRRHLLSVFEAHRVAKESRVLHLERKTGLELGVDTREIALGVRPDGVGTVVVGGLFRRERFVSGVLQLLRDEGLETKELEAPKRIQGPRGVLVGMAEDGTIVLGGDERAFASGLKRSEASPGAVAKKPALVVRSGRGFDGAALGFGAVTDFSLTVTAAGADVGPFVLALDFGAQGNPSEAEFRQAIAPIVPKDVIFQSVSAGRYSIKARLSREEFDRAVAILGEAIARGLRIP